LKPVEPSAVVTAALDVLRPAAELKGVRLEAVMDSSAGPVQGDFQRLQQVVWNLLSNAIKFTPKDGGVHVEVKRHGSHIQITVKDTGAGISKDFLPYVFNRFSQADSSTTRAHGGLGVGLAITKSIVELHGGSVLVSSPGEGQGATFMVNLPLAATRKTTSDKPRSEVLPINVIESPKELVGLRILVVDDEPDTCEMLRFLFERSGALVETATSAQAALALIDQWNPDVLVSDIGMPDIDGYELIRRIRTQGSKRNIRIPAVALTVLARIEDRVKVLSAGYQMHVAKPVEPVELLTVVASLAALANKR